MSETDRERCILELQQHQHKITTLSQTLVDLDRSLESSSRVRGEALLGLERHIAFINAQVMRHRISMALINSRLSSKQSTGALPQGT